jgi:hypothetical protein
MFMIRRSAARRFMMTRATVEERLDERHAVDQTSTSVQGWSGSDDNELNIIHACAFSDLLGLISATKPPLRRSMT